MAVRIKLGSFGEPVGRQISRSDVLIWNSWEDARKLRARCSAANRLAGVRY